MRSRYSFGLGYGLSMTANAALTAAVAKRQHRTHEQHFGRWGLRFCLFFSGGSQDFSRGFLS